MRRRPRTHLLALSALAALALTLVSCGQPTAAGGAAAAGRIPVVTSTNVYADIARQIGGDAVDVTAVITKLSQDPHSYEATAQDKLLISKSSLLIENGGGYDDFIHTLADDLGLDHGFILTAVEVSGLAPEESGAAEPGASREHAAEDHAHDHGEFNEHVWYDLASMAKLADAIAGKLGALAPEQAADFTANAAAFTAGIAGLQAELDRLKEEAAGARYAVTEPVPGYLLQDAGLADATPEGFSEAIEAETDVPPLVMKNMSALLSERSVALLAYNEQTEGPQTLAVRKQAEAAGVPVLNFTETLPDGQDYLGWMSGNIAGLDAVIE